MMRRVLQRLWQPAKITIYSTLDQQALGENIIVFEVGSAWKAIFASYLNFLSI